MWWLLLLLALIIAYCIFQWQNRRKRIEALLASVEKFRIKRDKLFADIQASCAQLPTETRNSISQLNLSQLIEALRNRQYTALDALRTYQANALEAHHKTNCILTFIEEADDWAKELDKKAEDQDYVLPPLFGVPFSIKEAIKIKGYARTCGYAHRLTNIQTEDAVIVERIKQLGGVPFVTSTVPQSVLSFACVSPVHGITCNAHMAERTCGGSSGGEAALIACGGSLIGIGTDLGGSIRYPCHFNGIVGLKPTHMRFAQESELETIPGRPMISVATGPMAARVDDLVTFLRIIWGDNWISHRDPYVPPVCWNQQLFRDHQPLTIGYYIDDGWFKPTPALQTAVLKAVDYLKTCGHTLIELDPPDLTEAFLMYINAIGIDGGKSLLANFKKDLSCPENQEFVCYLSLPLLLRYLLGQILRFSDIRQSKFLLATPMSTTDLRKTCESIHEYRIQFMNYMKKLHIDAIVCPVQVVPAVEHRIPTKLLATTSYCTLFNLLDFAAGTLKVMNITEKEENELRDYPESNRWEKTAKEATKGSIGLPVGVQIAAPPYHEETVLRLMRELESNFQ